MWMSQRSTRGWAIAALLLALVGASCASINDDRDEARTACYKDCLSSFGWDPVCVWNPQFPKPTTHGGGSFVYPNECTAKCASQYAKYSEARNLEVRYRVRSLPDRCYKKVWQIYFSYDDQRLEDPLCWSCPPRPSSQGPPRFKAIQEEQCNMACADRDGWKPLCIRDSLSNKKLAFGNACVARCSGKYSPDPLYYIKLSHSCRTLFEMGKTSATCQRCPSGKPSDLPPIDNDRVVARTKCYKYCISSAGWDPVCVWNPKYPEPTTHGGGSSVWPNACTAECMEQYAKYGEYRNLEVRWKESKPQECEDRLWDIWYLDSTDPSAPEDLRQQCLECSSGPA